MGREQTPETRAKISAARLGKRYGPRTDRPKNGHGFARRWFDLPDLCERCHEVPPLDRHHKDDDPTNNAPENIAFLCRRCHQIEDGRLERFREIGRSQNGNKTHCDSGHPFDEENTYVYFVKGERHRGCRRCRREADVRYKARRREIAARRLAIPAAVERAAETAAEPTQLLLG